MTGQPLPITAVLDELGAALNHHNRAILIAPPGAGKTTGVPIALLDAPWRADGTILVLEPRRIAARGAAQRMANLLGETLGERVGLRTRFDSKASARTRILVVTEGVFTRMVVDDPELSGIAAVLFDEFHERSLDADFGLALALESQFALRLDLRLLVMSATLDDQRLGALLGSAPLIRSEGRHFPIETRYLGRDATKRIEDQMASAILSAVRGEKGSILAFLPGQGEIERVARLLDEANPPPDTDLCPLYGALDFAKQDAAIKPAPPGRRKIVLATSIAETSITIEGVRIVIDSGLARVPRYEPDLGLSRLETVRVSRASADQRRGRAGRTEPGIAIRLWDEAQDHGLLPFNRPEILEADLTRFRLDCAGAGIVDPASLTLLDPPPKAALSEANTLLTELGALDEDARLTPKGRQLRELPIEPRLAAMVLDAASRGQAEDAALIAALISERGLGGMASDVAARLERLRHDRSPKAAQARQMAGRWAKRATELAGNANAAAQPLSAGAILALAFPDRVGKLKAQGSVSLANGRQAVLDSADPLARADHVVAAEITGSAARARITLGAEISRTEIEDVLGHLLKRRDVTRFEPASNALRRRRETQLEHLVLESAVLPVEASDANAALLAEAAAKSGIERLGWSRAQLQLRARIGFLRKAGQADWPDLSNSALAETARDWLAPFLIGKTGLGQIDAETCGAALDALIPWAMRGRLDAEAPTHFLAPTGNAHPIQYDGENAPLLSIRVQEMFGLKTHPSIAGGRLPLTLELLSPAHRPIQITKDLPRFWAGSWADVRSEMRGRYPKHVWPDDPANAMPTHRAKPRGT
ncbi:MAG: ATP-dependent helicase HrpB [Rhizobiales bacterium]|nr:ATP-dependent helicase HrpB [Hyphomicrobiales bacterium]